LIFCKSKKHQNKLFPLQFLFPLPDHVYPLVRGSRRSGPNGGALAEQELAVGEIEASFTAIQGVLCGQHVDTRTVIHSLGGELAVLPVPGGRYGRSVSRIPIFSHIAQMSEWRKPAGIERTSEKMRVEDFFMKTTLSDARSYVSPHKLVRIFQKPLDSV